MRPHLLLVQHNAIAAAATLDALRGWSGGAFTLEVVRRCADAMSVLSDARNPRAPPVDPLVAILLDPELPDCSEVAAFSQIMSSARLVPVLVLCDTPDEVLALVLLHHGAADYLLRDRVDGYTLSKALNGIIERAAFAAKVRDDNAHARRTLDCIGDAVIETDLACRITYLNAAAERLTGWSHALALGVPIDRVCVIVDGVTRRREINPMALAIQTNRPAALAPHCVLIRRDGSELCIEDSAAPVLDDSGRVIGAVMVFHDVTSLREHAERMAYLAEHDPLTDLCTRTVLRDRITQAIANAGRHSYGVAVLFLDIDYFKTINDTHGHDIGDELLRLVALRLRHAVRCTDTVSREGGDEFVILLSEIAHSHDAELSAAKLRSVLAPPYLIGTTEYRVTVSIGIATWPEHGHDIDSLLRSADTAMYRAKEGGRDAYSLACPTIDRSLERRRLISR